MKECVHKISAKVTEA